MFSLEDGLLGFLDGWSFTVAEDTADEVEVAVDPEMLGKVFENLIADDERKAQGTIYTPRPVVQFMCREALVPYLQRTAEVDGGRCARPCSSRTTLSSASPRTPGPRRRCGSHRRFEALAARHPRARPSGRLRRVPARHARRGAASATARAPHDRTGASRATTTLHAWKLHAIEHGLFGVDINPTAIELCRLRLWLSLLVEAPARPRSEPLPNLEYRTIAPTR